jgi:hypothetical protein
MQSNDVLFLADLVGVLLTLLASKRQRSKGVDPLVPGQKGRPLATRMPPETRTLMWGPLTYVISNQV